jgi:predicted nucleotidyltransferase
MDDNPILTRDQILTALTNELISHPFIYAVWEGGSAAFGRQDQWSDIDLMIDVEDDHVPETFAVVEQVLTNLSPIELRYEIPQPTWHGHSQTFYQLRDAGEFMLIDMAVMKHSNQNKFLETELHGQALVLFDRANVVQPPPLNRAELEQTLHKRLEQMWVTFHLFQSLVKKEILRQNPIDAFAFYQGFTIRPLVELLRIQYQPARHQFGLRYIYHDLPMAHAKRMERLIYISDLDDLANKHNEAVYWFEQIWKTLSQQKKLVPEA